MNRFFVFLFFIGASVIGSAFSASAQKKVVADKIVGIVGDKIILRSDLINAMLDEQRNSDRPSGRNICDFLQEMLATKALVLQAEKDSLPVSDEEVDAEIDQRIRYYISVYGSKEMLEEIAQKTVYQIREDARPTIRDARLAKQMQEKIVKNVRITPTEVKAYFEKIPPDSLPFYEAELEIGEITIYPKASRDIELLAIEELNGFKKQVESGQRKFEILADLYSDDKGTQAQGGTLLLNRKEGGWDPTFMAAAFRLKEGEISPVIKSKFGYHIIQLVNRSGDDALVRHILKIPQVTQAEIDEALVKLDTVRANLISGTIDFGAAVAKYSDDDVSKYTGGLRLVTIDQLDKDLVANLQKLKVGEYSQPMAFKDERGKQGVRIVYLRSTTEPHRENLRDDYSKIADRALEEKKYEAIEKWFNEKIPTYYIMIDDEFKNCPQIAPWLKGIGANQTSVKN